MVENRDILHYEIHGEGRPLLCIHGLGSSLYTWRELVTPGSPLLAGGCKVITPDLKGFGQSPKPMDTRYSTVDHTDLVHDFIQGQALTDLTLIGNSLGGAIALLLAIRLTEQDPTRLRALVLIDPGAYPDLLPGFVTFMKVPLLSTLAISLIPASLMARFLLRQCYYDRDKITTEQVAAYAAPIASLGGRHAILQTGRQIVPANYGDLAAKFKDIKVPTLIIWGAQDRVIPLEAGLRLRRTIVHAELLELDRCGHLPQEERPTDTIAALMRFLKTT
jgi:pimeloyl-ACP methyl ester carboxylesterase